MSRYVAGLLFGLDRSRVALIKKLKGPSAVIGRWNGIGGKIEPTESSYAAIQREFMEESGVSIANWALFMELSGNEWAVDFYHAFSDYGLSSVRTVESEEVGVFEVTALPNVVPNLRWIIPMALGHVDDNVLIYDVYEKDVMSGAAA